MENLNLSREIEGFQNPTWLSHLILENDADVLSKLMETKDYDFKNVTMELTLNGVVLRKSTLEVIFGHFMESYIKQAAEENLELAQRARWTTREEEIKEAGRIYAIEKLHDMVNKLEFGEE